MKAKMILRLKMREKGCSVAAIAQMINATETEVREYIQQRAQPSDYQKKILCDFFGCCSFELFPRMGNQHMRDNRWAVPLYAKPALGVSQLNR